MKKVLIISIKHLGDVVTTTSVLPLLKDNWPGVQIDYLVNPVAAPLIRSHAEVNEVYECGRHLPLKRFCSLAWQLLKQRYGAVLDFSEGDRGAMWGFLCLAKKHIGYRSKKSHFFRNILHSHLLPDRTVVRDRHVTECHADAIRILGAEFDFPPLPSLHYGCNSDEKVRAFLLKNNIAGNFVICHWTPKDGIRRWGADNCAKAMDWCSEKIGTVLVVHGGDENERIFVQSLRQLSKHGFISAENLDLDCLVALASKAYLTIAVDSLVGHIAGAVSTPVLSLFGPASDIHWRPRGVLVRLVKMNLPCQPCVTGGCLPGNISRCLKEMSFESFVMPELEELVKEIQLKKALPSVA